MGEQSKAKVLSKVNKERVVGLLQEMVRIPSYTGEELRLAEYMADWLQQHGLEMELQACQPTQAHKKSANVIATLRGTGGGRCLMLNGHLDTDAACGEWKYDPWDPVIFNGNKMNGIGTTNMKGGDAAMIEAVLAVKDAGITLKGDIIIALVCEELQGGWGIDTVLRKYTADAGIVTEPSNFTIGYNPSPGISRVQVQIYGKTAHIQEQNKAINATFGLAKVIRALEKLEFPYTNSVAPAKHPGYPVMAISSCRSGVGEEFYDGRIATIGDRALLKMDIRYDNNQTEGMVCKDVQNVLDSIEKEDPRLRTKLEPIPTYITRPSYELPMDTHIVQVLQRAHERVFGRAVERTSAIAGQDGAFMWAKANIPTVAYGMGGGSQHDPAMILDTPDLYINIDELQQLAKILALCCVEVCNTAKGRDR